MPLTSRQFQTLQRFSPDFQIASADFYRKILFHLPRDPLLSFLSRHNWIISSIASSSPIPSAETFFTDASKLNKIAIFRDQQLFFTWSTPYSSTQHYELFAVYCVLFNISKPVNVVIDSQYVAHVFPLLPIAILRASSSPVFRLLQALQQLLRERVNAVFITHICSHTRLPGPLTYGNDCADKLLTVAFASTEEEQQMLHSNAGRLHQKWKIPFTIAKQIVRTCSVCHPLHLRQTPPGTNPRGCVPNQIWQMDVTHFLSFGRLKYIHVVINTFSGFI